MLIRARLEYKRKDTLQNALKLRGIKIAKNWTLPTLREKLVESWWVYFVPIIWGYRDNDFHARYPNAPIPSHSNPGPAPAPLGANATLCVNANIDSTPEDGPGISDEDLKREFDVPGADATELLGYYDEEDTLDEDENDTVDLADNSNI